MICLDGKSLSTPQNAGHSQIELIQAERFLHAGWLICISRGGLPD